MKCSDVRWNGAVENLNGVKPNERVVKWSKVYWSGMKVLVTVCLPLLQDI